MGCFGSKKNKVEVTNKSTTNIDYSKIEHASDLVFQTSNLVFHKKWPIGKDYKFGVKLGEGAFGSVQTAVHKTTGQSRAVKSVRKSVITQDMREQSHFFNEIDIMRKIDHPNIVKMYEFYEDTLFYHIVTEMMNGGELFDYIIKRRTLSESVAGHFLKQILSAVSYCHERGIVHRDIKPENLLLDSESPDATLKVIDFGTSTLLGPKEKLHMRYGTSYYIAPEVLSREYDSKCDIWSCGVILYILISGSPPFQGRNDAEILSKVHTGEFSMSGPEWSRASQEVKNLIERMLNITPSLRPTAAEALEDPWFKLVTESNDSSSLIENLETLKKLRADIKLQQAVMTFIGAQMISKEDKKRLTETFQALDTNGDGKLSKEELLNGFINTMTISEAINEVERIMNEVDVDENGYIEYSEFVTAAMNREKLLSKDNLEAAFGLFDIDGSGSISALELRQMFGEGLDTTDAVWDELIKQVDQDGDGEIDIKEFKEMMLKAF